MTQLFMTNCLARTGKCGNVEGRKSLRKIVLIQFKATVVLLVLLCDSLITNNFRCNYAKNVLSINSGRSTYSHIIVV